MRHGFKKRTLNKKIAHRRAMFANLAVALAKHEQIKTTKGQIESCKTLKHYRNIRWIMRGYDHDYINMVLSDDEMLLMEDFLDKLIYKKEKELNVLKEQFSKY